MIVTRLLRLLLYQGINSYLYRFVDSNMRCLLTCLFAQSQKWWLLFQCILKMEKKIKIFILVTVELSRRIKNHLRSIRFLSNNLRTHEREKLHKDTHFYNTRRLYFLKIKHTWINSLNKGGIVYITTHGIFKFLAKELLKKKKKQTNDALLIYCLIQLQIKLSVTHVTS